MNILNKSELARNLGLTPETFRKKVFNIGYNKLNKAELLAIEYLLIKDTKAFIKQLKTNIKK